jgi:hypothetical protein
MNWPTTDGWSTSYGGPAWSERWADAACVDPAVSPELPFSSVAETKALCRECPLRTECRELAMKAERGHTAKSRFGVFGGLDPTQREVLAEKRGDVNRRAYAPRNKGIVDGQDCAGGCGQAVRVRRPDTTPAEGETWHHARGMCSACYHQGRKARAA